jgi:hypothetical protein
MSSSYTITPANQHCVAATTVKVISSPGTSTSNTSNSIDELTSQISKDAQFDTSAKTVTSLYKGGGEEESEIQTQKFTVTLKKKQTIINALDEIDALQIFITKKDIKKDVIVYVNDTTYILRVKEKSKTPSKIKSKIQFIKI